MGKPKVINGVFQPGAKVVIRRTRNGVLSHELGKYSTIIKYTNSEHEKFFKDGAYYLNPPVGNNTHIDNNGVGWGIGEQSFDLLSGYEGHILKDTYFVIMSHGDQSRSPKLKEKYPLHTVMKQSFTHAAITPISVGSSPRPCVYFGYRPTAKASKTVIRYATSSEIALYNKARGSVYVGPLTDSKILYLGHSEHCEPSKEEISPVAINSGFSNEECLYTGNSSIAIGQDNICIGTDSISGSTLAISGSGGGASYMTKEYIAENIRETKEQRLENLTKGIRMQKAKVIPTKKKKPKRLI